MKKDRIFSRAGSWYIHNVLNTFVMEDRLLMWKGKRQIYGTQTIVFRDDKKVAIWPIEDPKNVNERRKRIGFDLTVEENADRLKAIYNEDEQLPIKSKR